MSEARGLFSSAYWAFHRNTLLFSLVLLIVSLPGVELDPNPTVVVFQFSHLAGRALKWAIALAALYALLAYILEWRHEAYGFYLTEHGLLRDNSQQVSAVLEAIQGQIQSAQSHQAAALGSLKNIEIIIREFQGKVDEISRTVSNNALASIEMDRAVAELQDKITADFVDGNSTLSRYEPNLEFLNSLISRSEVATNIRRHVSEFAQWILSAKVFDVLIPKTSNFQKAIREFVTNQKAALEAEANVVQPLADYNEKFSSLRTKLMRQRQLTNLRVWVFGIGIATIVFVVALAHFIGSEIVSLAPSITQLV